MSLTLPTTPTRDQELSGHIAQIRSGVQMLAAQMLSTYRATQDRIHHAKFTEEEVLAKLGADYGQLQIFAVLLKSALNKAATLSSRAAVIVDTVPEAVITMPGG